MAQPQPLNASTTGSNPIWTPRPSRFRNSIPSAHFPAAKGRYVLYVNSCCPWAHRTGIVHAMKGLENVVQLVEVDARDPTHGWWFSGRRGPDRDPLYGVKYLKELYAKADPHYSGRITVPLLWDKEHQTIVNNESSEIIRMFYDSFDQSLPPEIRESNKGDGGLLPKHLQGDIEAFNAWVYENVNNGVYKAGFASSQASYDEHITRLFQSLDRLEDHLTQPGHHPFLFGDHVTEADIRLFPTLIRFDVVYYTLFKCNLKMIRIDYPRLHAWLRRLYWSEGPETAGDVFKRTTLFEQIKCGYSSVAAGNGIVPKGPMPHILPL
ncbi:transferase [Massariosphaeria phaeospora]|uniref:Transferase n=1 Tax=Massariosphaeria phaeospora TaxID=100035 RepID=A0A7C8M5V8_9PLEO|nr:transferase [Massariosphaeria phaeospora]